MVAVKEFKEAGLGAGSAFDTAERQIGKFIFQPLKIQHKILQIQAEAFADRGQLGGLIVRKPERGHIFVLHGELGKVVKKFEHLAANEFKTVAHLNKFGIIRNIAAGGAEVDDPGSAGRSLSIGIDVGHDVVAHLPLPRFGAGKISVNIGGKHQLHKRLLYLI